MNLYECLYEQEEFNRFVLEHKVLGFFDKPITLKSGRTSNWYVNWRTVTEDVFLTSQLALMVLGFTLQQGLKPDTFYGTPEGATKIALTTQLLNAQNTYSKGSHVFAMGRGKPKEHGSPKDRFFLGVPRGKTVILEDVTTTGGSLLQTIDQCLEAKVQVIGAIGLTNRMELRDDGKSVEQVIHEKRVPYFAMSNALELLPLAYQRVKPDIKIGLAIEEEFKQFGVQEIKLVTDL